MILRMVIQTNEKHPRRWFWWKSSDQAKIVITAKEHICGLCSKTIPKDCAVAHIQVSNMVKGELAGPIFTGYFCPNCFTIKKVRLR